MRTENRPDPAGRPGPEARTTACSQLDRRVSRSAGFAVAVSVGAAAIGWAPVAGGMEPEIPTDRRAEPNTTDSGFVVEASEYGSLRVVDEPRAAPVGVWIQCSYFDVASVDAPPELLATPVTPRAGSLHTLICWYRPDDAVVPGYPALVVHDPSEPVPGLVDVFDVAAHARSQIDFEMPRAELSPPTTQIVGIPTWLALVSELDYPDVTAQAGLAWATVRTRLRDVEWELGDGTTVVCGADVAATRYDPMRARADQSSECTHTHVTSSGSTAWAGAVTVNWSLEWVNHESPGAFEPWTTFSLSVPVVYEVMGLQAVIR